MVAVTPTLQARAWGNPPLMRLALIFCLMFVSVCGGLWLTITLGRITAIWVANALLVYFLLTSDRRDWPMVLTAGIAGGFCGDMFMGDDVFRSAYLTLCNTLGVLLIAAPFRYFELHESFSRPRPLCVFYALAVGPAPAIPALLAGLYFHFWSGRGYFTAALDWYATDALCYSIIVPILMTVRGDALKKMFARDELVTTVLLLCVVAATIALNYYAKGWPLAFLFFPAVILVTFQRGFAGGAIALLMSGAYLMYPILTGGDTGTLKVHSIREQIIIVQVFMAVTGFSVILVGAALAERRRLEEGLAAAIVRTEASREEALVARDAAERANRMKSMFLATMSHELRTPLNAIIGFSELIHTQLYGPHSDPRYAEYAGLIQNAGRHLLSLINDILDMSKIEAGKFELHRESFDMRGVVRDCLDMMSERAQQGGVALVDDLPASPLRIEADQRAIKQILLNLLSNAVKFTRAGGRVTVRARLDAGNLTLAVIDTGIGILADQLSRLGNPFVQVRTSAGSTHEGTGLGLALVRALAEIHEGSLKLESAPGRGTSVFVTIPAVFAHAAANDSPRLARIA
jgi:signal transduction histidine kinase